MGWATSASGHRPGLIVQVQRTGGRGRLSDLDEVPIPEDLVVAGDTVWTRNVATGRNDGTFMSHPPTGRTFRIHVFDVIRVRGGRIVEHWGVPDRLGVLFQLGASLIR